MREHLFEDVAARDVEDQRSPAARVGVKMEVTRHQSAVPRNINVFEPIGRELADLIVAAAQTRIQKLLLFVQFEDRVLSPSVSVRGAVVETERSFGVASVKLDPAERLHPLR